MQLFANGQCGCLGFDLTQGDDYETIYNRLDLIDSLIGNAPTDVKRQVVEIICSSTVNDGDHLQVRPCVRARPVLRFAVDRLYQLLLGTSTFLPCDVEQNYAP